MRKEKESVKNALLLEMYILAPADLTKEEEKEDDGLDDDEETTNEQKLLWDTLCLALRFGPVTKNLS